MLTKALEILFQINLFTANDFTRFKHDFVFYHHEFVLQQSLESLCEISTSFVNIVGGDPCSGVADA